MKLKNIYIILILIILIIIVYVYRVITSELKNIKPTPLNTRELLCPDYWYYDKDTKMCKPPIDFSNVGLSSDWTGNNFSDYTFCEKQQYAYDLNIPWDGVSNVYDEKCDVNITAESTDTLSDEKDHGNKHSTRVIIFYYSFFIGIIIFWDFVLDKKGNFILVLLPLTILFYYLFNLLGIDIFRLFGLDLDATRRVGRQFMIKPNDASGDYSV